MKKRTKLLFCTFGLLLVSCQTPLIQSSFAYDKNKVFHFDLGETVQSDSHGSFKANALNIEDGFLLMNVTTTGWYGTEGVYPLFIYQIGGLENDISMDLDESNKRSDIGRELTVGRWYNCSFVLAFFVGDVNIYDKPLFMNVGISFGEYEDCSLDFSISRAV